MNRFLTRLFFIAALLCGVLGPSTGAGVPGCGAKSIQKSEEHIRQGHDCPPEHVQECKGDDDLIPVAEEPQGAIEFFFRSAPSSHRVASSRPTRLMPTHGGKPGKHPGRWAANEVYKPFNTATLQLCSGLDSCCTAAAPSRLYYVIALRRLLC